MSMVCLLLQATDETIRALLAEPTEEKINEFLDSEQEQCDLEKSWHGLHWLLTGTAWMDEEPLCYLVAGGRQIGDVSLTYGPARALMSNEVAAFDGALAGLSHETLEARFDPTAMMAEQIYPEIWECDPAEDDTLEYLLSYFDELKTFISATRAKGLGLITYLT